MTESQKTGRQVFDLDYTPPRELLNATFCRCFGVTFVEWEILLNQHLPLYICCLKILVYINNCEVVNTQAANGHVVEKLKRISVISDDYYYFVTHIHQREPQLAFLPYMGKSFTHRVGSITFKMYFNYKIQITFF